MKFFAYLLSLAFPFLATAQSITGYVYNWTDQILTGQSSAVTVFSTSTNLADDTFIINNDKFNQPDTSLINEFVTPLIITADSQYLVTFNPSSIASTSVSSTLYVIDTTNPETQKTITVEGISILSLAPYPLSSPTSPNYSYIYALGYTAGQSQAKLAIINLINNTYSTVDLPQGNYSSLAAAALQQSGITHNYLYAVNATGGNNVGAVEVIDIDSPLTPSIATINLNNTAIAYITIAPDASPPMAYVSTSAFVPGGIAGSSPMNQIIPIDLSTNTALSPISYGTSLTGPINLTGPIVATSDGTQIFFIAVSSENPVNVYNTTTMAFTPVTLPSTANNNQNISLALTPNNQTLYVLNNATALSLLNRSRAFVVPVNTLSSTTDFAVGFYGVQLIFANPTETAIFAAMPEIGPASGGIPVTLTGTGFNGTMAVLFGSTSVPFTQISDTQITATTPPGEPDTVVPITLLTTHGKSRRTPASHHIYVRLIFAPTQLKGFQVKNKFATQTERVNILRWDPPTHGDSVVEYRIYRDAKLKDRIATISAKASREFRDHNCKERSYTYYIVSVNQADHQSVAASVTVAPQ